MKPISCNQEMGDGERLLCPGAPQGPARYQTHLCRGPTEKEMLCSGSKVVRCGGSLECEIVTDAGMMLELLAGSHYEGPAVSC